MILPPLTARGDICIKIRAICHVGASCVSLAPIFLQKVTLGSSVRLKASSRGHAVNTNFWQFAPCGAGVSFYPPSYTCGAQFAFRRFFFFAAMRPGLERLREARHCPVLRQRKSIVGKRSTPSFCDRP